MRAVAIVTGGASGMGEAVVAQLLSEGSIVVAADINEDKLAGLSASHGSDDLVTMCADVANEAQAADLVRSCLTRFGRLDHLVNCAGAPEGTTPIERLTGEAIDRILSVNLKGTLVLMREAVCAMRPRRQGSIVNISSTAGIRPMVNVNAYTGSKYGVVGVTQSVALEVAPDGIRVNVICPGLIDTPMYRKSSGTDGQGDQYILATPMRRIGLAREIADAVSWLLSERASFVTGAVLPVDGGLALV